MDKALTAETIDKYERRVEEIEAARKRNSTIERFERRIQEIEAQIKPQLDEMRALKAGLVSLRQGSEGELGGEGRRLQQSLSRQYGRLDSGSSSARPSPSPLVMALAGPVGLEHRSG